MVTPVLLEDLGSRYPTEKSKTKARFGLFRCHCGKEFTAVISSVKTGNTKSCGCYHSDTIRGLFTTHGLSKHPLYISWKSIKTRCFNTNGASYKDYGGRGITMCPEWKNNFLNFYTWSMENGYEKGLSIDRINVNGNYEPSNCRWANTTTQAQNTRLLVSSNTSGYRGVSMCKGGRYRARITLNKVRVVLGTFSTAEEAARAYDASAIINNTEYPLNFPRENND